MLVEWSILLQLFGNTKNLLRLLILSNTVGIDPLNSLLSNTMLRVVLLASMAKLADRVPVRVLFVTFKVISAGRVNISVGKVPCNLFAPRKLIYWSDSRWTVQKSMMI